MLCLSVDTASFYLSHTMKILLLGDYSGVHATLARCLRRRGHDVTLVSDRGDFMMTDADISLKRRAGFKGGVRYLFDCLSLLPSFKGYDVVQLINPNFLRLKPSKIRFAFNVLKANNRAVCLTLAGNDYHFVKTCVESDLFRYSEFRIGRRPTNFAQACPDRESGWLSKDNQRYAEYLYDSIDGAMAVLPEYYMAASPYLADRLSYTGLPVDLDRIPLSPFFFDTDGPVIFFAGIKSGMAVQKGFDLILPAVSRLVSRYPDKCRLTIVRDLPLDKYLREMSRAHVIIDQLYSYSPATNALQAMASGRVAASGAEPEYYDFIVNPDVRPVVRLNPFVNIEKELFNLIDNRETLKSLALAGPSFVKTHNDAELVVDRFLAHWQSVLEKK